MTLLHITVLGSANTNYKLKIMEVLHILWERPNLYAMLYSLKSGEFYLYFNQYL